MLVSNVPRRRVPGLLAVGREGRGKKSISRLLPNRPLPLNRFDTRPQARLGTLKGSCLTPKILRNTKGL